MQIIFSVSLVCLYIIEVLFYLHMYTTEPETLKRGALWELYGGINKCFS